MRSSLIALAVLGGERDGASFRRYGILFFFSLFEMMCRRTGTYALFLYPHAPVPEIRRIHTFTWGGHVFVRILERVRGPKGVLALVATPLALNNFFERPLGKNKKGNTPCRPLEYPHGAMYRRDVHYKPAIVKHCILWDCFLFVCNGVSCLHSCLPPSFFVCLRHVPSCSMFLAHFSAPRGETADVRQPAPAHAEGVQRRGGHQ